MIILTRMEIILTILQIIVRFYLYGYIERRKSKTRDSLRIINQATLLSRSIRSLFELRRGKVSKGSKNCVNAKYSSSAMRRQRWWRGKKRRKRPRRSPRQSTRSRILTPLGNKVVLLLRQKSTSPTALCFSSRCDKKFNGSIPSLADNPILNGLNFYVYYVLLFYVLFIIYSDKKIKTNILL